MNVYTRELHIICITIIIFSYRENDLLILFDSSKNL